MRTEEIEKALRELPAPAPPTDLKARCLATIPVAVSERHLTARRQWRPATGLRTAIATVIVLAVAVLMIRSLPGPVSGDAVFAASLEAMSKVSFYHVKDREVGFWPDGGYKGGDGWYTGRWINGETWYDDQYGLVSESGGTTFARQMRLDLPDGRHLERLFSDYKPENNLRITEFGPKGWERTRTGQAKQFMDLREMAPGINSGESTPRLVSTTVADWKSRKAMVITFVTPPIPAKAARGAPTVRSLIYVDPATHLCMVLQSYARSPGHPETLVREAEFDFTRRPDRSLFDPERLERGASKITRQKGRPGIIVSPE
jgi:hypothetical protein